MLAKGQIISKGFLVSSISYKKQTKEFDFTTMIPQVDLFLFVLIEDTKKTFRNYLTFNSETLHRSNTIWGGPVVMWRA